MRGAGPLPERLRGAELRSVTLFLVCPPGGSIQQGQRDMQYVQMMKSKWRLKMGVKHNSTRQKHFRAQVIF